MTRGHLRRDAIPTITYRSRKATKVSRDRQQEDRDLLSGPATVSASGIFL